LPCSPVGLEGLDGLRLGQRRAFAQCPGFECVPEWSQGIDPPGSQLFVTPQLCIPFGLAPGSFLFAFRASLLPEFCFRQVDPEDLDDRQELVFQVGVRLVITGRDLLLYDLDAPLGEKLAEPRAEERPEEGIFLSLQPGEDRLFRLQGA
jgi:hypothetical protein